MSAPADLVAGAFGARGSGKSLYVRRFLESAKPSRLLIVDPMNEYKAEAARVPTLAKIGSITRGATFQARYVPDFQGVKPEVLALRFAAICALAALRGNLVMVVEEAQLFTRAAGAPMEWSNCTLRGRHLGLRIFAVSQRPAHMDKDFFTNATFLRTGRLNFADDISVMANALRVPPAAVAALTGHEWIGKDLLSGELTCEPADALERVARPAPVVLLPAKPAARSRVSAKKKK